MALLWSCRSEDFFQEENPSGSSTKLSSAKYASKSLWKEDVVYIEKVQQVFLKIANMEHVRANYGELNWDYAMSFGNFNETYALVPIIKDNKVVLLMEAVRIGHKLFLYEKDSQETIAFFNAAIYGKVIRYDESLSGKNGISSKALNYVCSTRTLSVGCDGEPGCVPYVKTETVCGFQQGGGPPKGFDPSGDPNLGSGGGADDGYEYPDPPEEEDPCERIKNKLTDPQFKAKINELKAQSTQGGEKGVKFKEDGTPSETITGGDHEVDLGDTAGFQGGYHNHTPTGIKMLSPPDIVKMLSFAMGQPNGNIGNGFMGMVGSEPCSCPGNIRYYNYMINFNGTAQELSDFLYSMNWDLNKLKKEYQILEGQMALDLSNVDYLGANLNTQGLEKLFFETLKGMGMEGKVNLQKIEDNGIVKNITLNSSGTSTTATPCP